LQFDDIVFRTWTTATSELQQQPAKLKLGSCPGTKYNIIKIAMPHHFLSQTDLVLTTPTMCYTSLARIQNGSVQNLEQDITCNGYR